MAGARDQSGAALQRVLDGRGEIGHVHVEVDPGGAVAVGRSPYFSRCIIVVRVPSGVIIRQK